MNPSLTFTHALNIKAIYIYTHGVPDHPGGICSEEVVSHRGNFFLTDSPSIRSKKKQKLFSTPLTVPNFQFCGFRGPLWKFFVFCIYIGRVTLHFKMFCTLIILSQKLLQLISFIKFNRVPKMSNFLGVSITFII